MMQDSEKIYRNLISAAAGEISFKSLVGTIVDHFGAGGGLIFELNRKTGEIQDWATPTLIVGEDGYNDHLNAINPRMRFSLRHAPGHIAYEGRFISESGMDRHEFYDWLKSFADFRYMLGSRLYDNGDVSVFHSVEFSRSHGHPDAEKIEAFRRLAPSIGNAWRLRKRVLAGERALHHQAWLPDHLPWSIFALSMSGEVTGMNAAGRALLEQADSVEIADKTLRAVHQQSKQALETALRAGLAGNASETLIKIGPEGQQHVVQILPVNPQEHPGPVQIAALVYIRNPLSETSDIGPVLGRLYRFTPAEQKLACLLAAGVDQSTAAEKLGLSRNTIRNRMQSIYAKSGTRRHSEFLIKILGVIEP